MDHDLRANELRAKVAIIMFGIVLVIQTVALISAILQYRILNEITLGHFIPQSQLEYNDLRQQVVTILHLIVLVISFITFVCWFRRSYYNLHLKAEVLSYSEGWAAGSWFVPFINLVRPYKIMQELHIETNNLIRNSNKNLEINNYISLINLWWTLWILSSIVGNICNRMYPNPQTVEDFINSTIASIIAIIFGIPFTIVAMILITKHSETENEFAKIYSKE